MQQTIKQFEIKINQAIEETIKQGFKEGKSKDQIIQDCMNLKAKFENEVKSVLG